MKSGFKCYVCERKATTIITGNAVCDYHATEEGFKELEATALREFFGEEGEC